jgi:hypothetical protein
VQQRSLQQRNSAACNGATGNAAVQRAPCEAHGATAQVVLKTLVLFHRLMHETFPACTRFTQKCVR